MNQPNQDTNLLPRSGEFPGLRSSEKIALAFFTYALIASWFFPLTLDERLTISAGNLVAMGVVLMLGRFGYAASSKFLTTVRDWLPCVLIILAYRESGLFLAPDSTHRLDNLFIVWDRAILASAWFQNLAAWGSPWLGRLMELSYLLVYPFVPLGFAAVYGAKHNQPTAQASENAIDLFWTSVLLAVLSSYALFPYFPLTPPRVIFHDFPAAAGIHAATGLPGLAVEPLFRRVNFWVLEHYSVQACIFPSGHVAGAVATALAVRAIRPRLSWVFVAAALAITVSTVYGRYHYTADAVAGALVGIAAFALAVRLRPKNG